MLEGFVPFPPEFAKRYREKGYWHDKSLAEEFAAVFRQYADRVAFIDRGKAYTYADVDRISNGLALNLLELGLRPLDRVVVQLPNVIEFVFLYFALQKIGCIPIAALVTHGVPGTEMVAYGLDFGGPLSSTQIRAVSSYLRSLEEDAAANPLWRTPLADSNLSGRDLFNMACSRCHGTDLSGVDDVAPALGPGSESVEDSHHRLMTQIADGGDEMPRFGGVLTLEQIEMVVAYLRQVQSGG